MPQLQPVSSCTRYSGKEEADRRKYMPDQKLSLEDILNEYSPENTKPKTSVGRVDAQKILNSTVDAPELIHRDAPRPPLSNKKSDLFNNAHRQPDPADEIKPADLSRGKISFVNTDSIHEIKSTTKTNIAGEYTASTETGNVSAGETPKIRRMSSSTRAREIEELKNSGKKRRRGSGYTYERESPDGEYMYTPPAFKKKKRSRTAMERELISSEGKKHITDIVPSPAAVEAAKPVQPAPRAQMTSINLSERPDYDASALDVHITQETDEYLSVRSKKKRTKRIVDFNYYGDVEDVGRDIFELKSTISVRVFILAMTSILSLFIALGNQFGLPLPGMMQISNTKAFLISNLVLGAIAVISSMAVITKGLKKLFTFKADSDSMTSVTALSCIATIIPAMYRPDMVLNDSVHIYMPVGILALLINSIGKLLIIRRAARNFRFISKNFDRHGVVYVRDEERAERLTRGTVGDFPILASTKKTDFLTDFLRYTYSSDMTDDYCRKASPLCLIFSIAIACFITLSSRGTLVGAGSAAFGFSIFSMLICATSCIAMPFVVNIPLEKTAEKAFSSKGIILGYQSVDDFYDTNSVLVNADSLFPEGTVKLEGIKVFSNTKIDEALLEAASLTHHAGSIMHQLFKDVTGGREEMLYTIENYSYEESMGMCGWINNKRVLFGNRELMNSHNIEGVPTKAKETEFTGGDKSAMYLSISGNLAAMFIVDITADKDVKLWLKKLCKNKVFVILKSVEPCLTLKKLHTLFGVPEEMIRILPKKLHEDFDEETKRTVRLSASMATTGKFASLAKLLVGVKTIHSAAIIGLIIQTASILLGFVLCSLLILSRAYATNYVFMSATALIIYNAACTLCTYIALSLKKI